MKLKKKQHYVGYKLTEVIQISGNDRQNSKMQRLNKLTCKRHI